MKVPPRISCKSLADARNVLPQGRIFLSTGEREIIQMSVPDTWNVLPQGRIFLSTTGTGDPSNVTNGMSCLKDAYYSVL